MFTFMLYNICDGITTARLQSSYSKNSLLINIAHTYLSLYMEVLLEGQTSIAYTCKKAVNFQTSGVKHAVFVITISICNPIFNFFQLAEGVFSTGMYDCDMRPQSLMFQSQC